MSDEDRMRAEIMAMRERGDQITDEVHTHLIYRLVTLTLLWVSSQI